MGGNKLHIKMHIRGSIKFCLKYLGLTGFSILFALTSSYSARAENRVALIIGNSAYEHTTPLPNPKNDAVVLTRVLTRLGFDVISGIDLKRQDFEQTVRSFATKLKTADVGLFFYSGHGLQVNGNNYLVPIDAKLADEADLEFAMVKMDAVMHQMERNSKTNLIFIDACRDNPLARTLARSMGRTRSASIGRGLAPVRSGIGSMITFATEPGNVALDGEGANSPFTTALVKHIETPGLDIAQLLRRVRRQVIDSTAGRQVPWNHSSLTDGFTFLKGAGGPALANSGAGSSAMELALWNNIKGSKSAADYQDYLTRFPKGTFAHLATRQVKKFKTAALGKLPSGQTGGSAKAFRDCEACPKMVTIPPGSFMMGSPDDDKSASRYERPQHKVTIKKPFAVGQFEITFDEWDACVADRGCAGYKPQDEKWGRGKRPVIRVNWEDAVTYLSWINHKTGKNYRLLSEAEWEYVARAGSKSHFSFGPKLTTYQAVFDGRRAFNGGPKGIRASKTEEVGQFKPNGFGVYDMHGNVSEWVSDCWHKSYEGAPTDGSSWDTPAERSTCSSKVRRGGSWYNSARDLRSAQRRRFSTRLKSYEVGFRVARDLE